MNEIKESKENTVMTRQKLSGLLVKNYSSEIYNNINDISNISNLSNISNISNSNQSNLSPKISSTDSSSPKFNSSLTKKESKVNNNKLNEIIHQIRFEYIMNSNESE